MYPMLIVAPLLALASTTPIAPDAAPSAPVATAEPAAPTSRTATLDENQRVCLDSVITGSLLTRRQCQTRAEWRAMGEKALANAR